MTSDQKEDKGGADRETTASPHAKDELFEAVEHFKKAANILFEKASRDPKVKSATAEAEKVIHKLGDKAEPLARQLTGELAKLTRRISDTVSEAVEGRRRSERPPPADAEEDKKD